MITQYCLSLMGYKQNLGKELDKTSAWFLVAIVVLAAIAITLFAAIALFCIYKGMNFSGNYSWAQGQWTPSLWIECKR